MFGAALLVAPRVWEEPGAYFVTLPAGGWFDYWTGERLEGGTTISAGALVLPELDWPGQPQQIEIVY